jgi:hypothetical protein
MIFGYSARAFLERVEADNITSYFSIRNLSLETIGICLLPINHSPNRVFTQVPLTSIS